MQGFFFLSFYYLSSFFVFIPVAFYKDNTLFSSFNWWYQTMFSLIILVILIWFKKVRCLYRQRPLIEGPLQFIPIYKHSGEKPKCQCVTSKIKYHIFFGGQEKMPFYISSWWGKNHHTNIFWAAFGRETKRNHYIFSMVYIQRRSPLFG